MKIHHIAICVDDIGEAIDWYCSKLNFEVDYQDESWALISFENSKVALVLPEQHPPTWPSSTTTHRNLVN